MLPFHKEDDTPLSFGVTPLTTNVSLPTILPCFVHVMVGVGRPFAWLFIRKLSPMFTEKFSCLGLVILGESVEIFESKVSLNQK